MVQVGERLTPLIEALRQQLQQAPLIHMDETILQVNLEPGRKASATSYMWVQRGGPPGQQIVLFDYAASRAGQVLREQKSRPLIEQLRTWLDKSLAQVLPKSALGKALHYLDGQWTRLARFLDDGLILLDNNPAENAIRPFVVGRKNWLFSQTPSGAHASAAIYSLIETAKANGLSPYAYLTFVFETLPTLDEDDDLGTLLPWCWKETLPL